jgi:hypothetical protein
MALPVIVICPLYVPPDKPIGFAVTEMLPGVCADVGVTVSQLPPETVLAAAEKETGEVENTDMVCAGTGFGVSFLKVKLREEEETVMDGGAVTRIAIC